MSVASTAVAVTAEAPRQGPPAIPGSIGHLTSEQEQAYIDLEYLLALKPERPTGAHERECRKRRLLRMLRSERFDVEKTFTAVHHHSEFWFQYGLADIGPDDVLDNTGVMFTCGEDKFGRPLMAARMCNLNCVDRDQAVHMAKRCARTMQRHCEQMGHGIEQIALVFDCNGIRSHNLSVAFAKEFCKGFARLFPERLGARVVVINVHWSMMWFWALSSKMMHPATKEKIILRGSDFETALLALLPENHPYFRYALAHKRLSPEEAALLPVPQSTPYNAKWKDALTLDVLDPAAQSFVPDKAAAYSRSTIARVPAVKKAAPARPAQAGSTWSGLFCCTTREDAHNGIELLSPLTSPRSFPAPVVKHRCADGRPTSPSERLMKTLIRVLCPCRKSAVGCN